MTNKGIALVSGSMSTSRALKKQLVDLAEYFDCIELYSIDEDRPGGIDCRILVYSSDILYDETQKLNIQINAEEEIVANRTIDFDNLDGLFEIRKNEAAYVVNDSKETTYQIINLLRSIGFEDISLIPYFPGEPVEEKVKFAITPGEINLVPPGIENIVNIGPRLMDFETVYKILTSADMLDHIGGSYSQIYLSKIINITKRSSRYAMEVEALNEQFSLILSSVEEGILVFDGRNKIRVVNSKFLEFFNIHYNNFAGRKINDLIKDQKIVDFCIGLKRESESLFVINRTNLVFSREMLSTGFTIVFAKNIEERLLETDRLNKELVRKGHVAKYTFDDIIGESPALKEAKYIARKLAGSELTILIEGESGTGKELFASSIHNESMRSSQAYLAINFSAFTDELIESELFGYEEGAFTGARKGGKIGLFELADKGTILLDEIGDISPKMQTKLLRVLQEGEIIRVGGSVIHSVDVRIIAATNKDLRKMVDAGDFREDLYYRLKMGTVKLPPLRQRRQDIAMLVDDFLQGAYAISEDAIVKLVKRQWRGNIRELKSTIEYMKAVSEDGQLSARDLPGEVGNVKNRECDVTEEERKILEIVYDFNRKGVACGRHSILRYSYESLGLTENQIRGRMMKLMQKGFLESGRGRSGAFITEEGKEVLLEK